MECAEAGDNAALLLRGVRRHQVRRGQVRPGTPSPSGAAQVNPGLRFPARNRKRGQHTYVLLFTSVR